MATDKMRLGVIGANVSYGWTPRAHMPAIANMPQIEPGGRLHRPRGHGQGFC